MGKVKEAQEKISELTSIREKESAFLSNLQKQKKAERKAEIERRKQEILSEKAVKDFRKEAEKTLMLEQFKQNVKKFLGF